jgi:hypothetical protein
VRFTPEYSREKSNDTKWKGFFVAKEANTGVVSLLMNLIRENKRRKFC